MSKKEPEIYISSIENFLVRNFADKLYKDYSFSIPEYQRPYKWTAENVIQLIDDVRETILLKKEKKLTDIKYRIGTVVLHVDKKNLNIVDGQQRFLSLNLIFRALKEILDNSTNIDRFIKTFNNKFSSLETKKNLKTNYTAIKDKLREISDIHEIEEIFNFLCSNCEFVIVILFDIGEAFQFFDSQNARGKDLEPYDLLKAYHLRAIKENYDLSQVNIDNIETNAITDWEKLAATDDLGDLFKLLFHIRTWGKMYNEFFFRKENIKTFKGLTEKKDFILPPMYFASLYLLAKIKENNSRNHSESNKKLPFQIDFPIINGEYFFYEIYKYEKIFREYEAYLQANKTQNKTTSAIIDFLNTYKHRYRKGDQYIRHLLDCVSIYYLGKFGFDDFDSVFIKLFEWTYMLRLVNAVIKRETIVNHTIKGTPRFNNLFKVLKESVSSKDILLVSPYSENSTNFEIKCKKETNKELLNLFSHELKLIKDNTNE